MKRIYCMIIGDIVKSRQIDAKERSRLQEKLKEALETVNYEYVLYICSRFSLTLGDEFQGGLYNSIHLFEILELLQKSVYPHKLRFGIGIDTLNTYVKYSDSLSTDGPAYYKARKAMEELKANDTFEYGYKIYSFKNDTQIINSLFQTVDCISSTWTDSQRKYIYALCKDETATSLANRKNVSGSTVSRALQRSHYKVVREAFGNISNYLRETYDVSDRQDDFLISYNKACYFYSKNLLDKALEIMEYTRPTEDVDKLFKNYMLSIIHFQTGSYQAAIDSAIEALQHITNDYTSIKVKLKNALGISYSSLGEYGEAEKYLSEALRMVSPENYTKKEYLIIKENIAILYNKKNRLDEAEQIFKDLYEIILTDYPDDIRLRVQLLNNLSSLYFKKEDIEHSMEICQEALHIAENSLDAANQAFAFIYWRKASLITRMGKHYKESIALLQNSAEIFRKNCSYSKELSVYKDLYKLCKDNYENIMADEYQEKIKELEKRIGR